MTLFKTHKALCFSVFLGVALCSPVLSANESSLWVRCYPKKKTNPPIRSFFVQVPGNDPTNCNKAFAAINTDKESFVCNMIENLEIKTKDDIPHVAGVKATKTNGSRAFFKLNPNHLKLLNTKHTYNSVSYSQSKVTYQLPDQGIQEDIAVNCEHSPKT